MTTPEWTTRTVVQRGIELPWERIERYGPTVIRGILRFTDRPPKGTVLESGTVFIPASTLYELAEQDVYDSQFGKVLLLGTHEGYALEQAGLAVEETKGGYHRTDKLLEFLQLTEETA